LAAAAAAVVAGGGALALWPRRAGGCDRDLEIEKTEAAWR